MNNSTFLELAVVVHGFMVLGIAVVVGAFMAMNRRHWHRLPILASFSGFTAYTLLLVRYSLVPAGSWWLKSLSLIYTVALAGLFLIAARAANDVE